MRYQNREQEAPASPLPVARRSLKNRCPERRWCVIPPERCCTPMIQQMRFGWGVPGPVVGRRGELAEKWGMFHAMGRMVSRSGKIVEESPVDFHGRVRRCCPVGSWKDTKREHSTGEKPRVRKTDFLVPSKKIIANRGSHNVENIQSIVLQINDKPFAL